MNFGHLLLVKADGGARSSVHTALLVLVFAGLIAIWMVLAFFARQRSMKPLRPGRFFLPGGVAGVFILLFQILSPYEVHVDVWFLTGVFGTLAAVSVVTPYFPNIRVRVVAKRFALVSMGLLIALGVAEAALRIWNPRISRSGFRNHMRVSPEYGWTNQPGAEGMNVNLGYHIKINSIGHRGPNYSFEKKSGVFRILGLGDSFTFGVGVEEEDTFLRQLEQNLRKKNYKVEIINAGVAGWHSVQSLHYLRKERIRFQPDLVLMSFYANDMDYTTMARLRNHSIAIRTRAEETSRRKQTGLSRYSRLYSTWANYRKIQKAAHNLRTMNPYRTFEGERKGLLTNFDKRGGLIVGLEKMVAAWAKTRDETGVPIVVTYIPPGGAIGAQDYQGESRALARVSRAYHIPYVDLVSPFEKHPDPRTLYLFSP